MNVFQGIMGIILIIIGIGILQITCRYGWLIWKKEAEFSFVVAFFHLGSLFLIFLGLRLCGVIFLNAFFFYPLLIFMVSWIIHGVPTLIYSNSSKIDKIIVAILALLIVATFIFIHWFYVIRTEPGKQRLDKFVEDTLFGTSTKTMEKR